jgi:hypothetical protein
MTTPHDFKAAFQLLDQYARTTHACFVAEMSPSAAGAGYTVCFRPTGSDRTSPNRFACKHLRISVPEIDALNSVTAMPLPIAEKLDAELPDLGKTG